MHVDGSRLDVGLRLPHRFEQLGTGLDAVAPLDQALEQLEFRSGELDFLPVRGHAMGRPVQDDRPPDEAAAGRHGRRRQAPQDRAHAQDQLLGGERLREVVIGAKGQPLDAIGLVLAGGQQQHAHVPRFVPAPQLGEDFEPGVPRQHQIEDDQIGPLFAGRAQRVRTGAGGRDAIAFLRKVIRNESRDVGLVVNNEDAMWGGCGRLIRHEQAGR